MCGDVVWRGLGGAVWMVVPPEAEVVGLRCWLEMGRSGGGWRVVRMVPQVVTQC